MRRCSNATDAFACLLKIDADTLGAAGSTLAAAAFYGTFIFVPVVDGKFIVERPTVTLGKKQSNGVNQSWCRCTNGSLIFALVLEFLFGCNEYFWRQHIYPTQCDQYNRLYPATVSSNYWLASSPSSSPLRWSQCYSSNCIWSGCRDPRRMCVSNSSCVMVNVTPVVWQYLRIPQQSSYAQRTTYWVRLGENPGKSVCCTIQSFKN